MAEWRGISKPAPVQQYVIAGIRITVYGLDRVHNATRKATETTKNQFRPLDVVCLWLFHSRLSSGDSMGPLADRLVRSVYGELGKHNSDRQFIAVSFDQRNHGSRLSDSLANRSWLEGNERHAPDMYSICQGTADDTSLLIRLIESYIFPIDHYGRPGAQIISHLAMGVSLGGHVAWNLAVNEPAIHGVIVVIGSPDYKRLMEDRAIRSKRISMGEQFFPSPDFPPALLSEVERTDPMQVLFETPASILSTTATTTTTTTPVDERQLERERVQEYLGGKCILIMSGENDHLVPYRVSVEPFLRRLSRVLSDSPEMSVYIDNRLYPNTGHEMCPDMVAGATDFVIKYVVQSRIKSRLRVERRRCGCRE